MEYLDIIDDKNNLTGRTEERELMHARGIWHREVALWIMNEQGNILLQKRAADKKLHPNKWGICAGHVDAGETVDEAMIRELEEELGLRVSLDELDFMFISKEQSEFPSGRKNYVFYYAYFLRTDLEISDYKIQTAELSEVKYIPFEELRRIIETRDPNFTFSSLDDAHRTLAELQKRLSVAK